MSIQRVTIKVSNILQGGKTCKNPTISAHLVNGLVQPCPISGGTIELELDGLEAGYCFDLVIDCEDCNACPPQVKRICLCDDSGDCAECETCITGICVSNCEPDEFCDNGLCKDCLTDEHCLCNQECINSTCACPPDLPIKVGDCCYECVEGTTNGCQLCVAGIFEAIDCGLNYLLDPSDCECKECLDSGDCTDINTCCVNGSCDCCPGYYFDPVSDGCLPIPPCSDKEDCPDCFDCVNGLCQEITCPAGYLRTGIEGHCCVKECDCDNPSCPFGSTCTHYDESSCYCKPCTGDCISNAECGDGCGCYDGKCKPKPKGCDGPCYTGLDCSFGCGCLDGECVDCKTLGCNNNDDCLLTDGCTCVGGNCINSPCDAPCVDGSDCPDGCGCDEGSCDKCSDVPCEDVEDCPDGCICNGGICDENPCDEVYCERPEDCGEGCGCQDGKCVPCSSLSCISTECDNTPGCGCDGSNCETVDDPCDDNLRITREDAACELKGTLDIKDCCSCPDIVLHMTGTFAGVNLTVKGELRKGTTAADTLLGSTGIDNELPLSGSVKFIVRQDEIEVDNGGAPTGLTRSTSQSVIKNYTGTDTKTQVFTIKPIGTTYADAGKSWKVIHVCVAIEQTIVFVFENECQYKVASQQILCDASGSGLAQLTKLVRCKTPLFTWSESANGTSYSVIKRTYSERFDSDTFIDFLDGADGLEACKYYKLNVDCGCDTEEFYSCHGDEGSATKVVFCDPADLTITSNNDCNTDIDIDEVTVCDVMCGATYTLYINGVSEGTFTPNGSCVLFAGGLNIVKPFKINQVKLVFNCDECADCTIVKTLTVTGDPCACSVSPMTISVDTTNACTTGIDYTITGGTGAYTVVLKRGITTIYSTTKPTNGTYTYNNILPNGSYVLKVTDIFGCVKTVGFIIISCCRINVTGLAYDCATQTISGTIGASNASGSYLVEIGSPAVHSFVNGVGAFSEVFDLIDGIYTVKVTDVVDGSCYWIGTLYVGCGGMNLDITAICDATEPTHSGISLDNFSGGTAPILFQLYEGSPVTVDGNGCPTDPGQFVTQNTSVPYTVSSQAWTSSTQIVVKLSDAAGRIRCFPGIYMLDCASNSFNFTTRFSCTGSQKRICVTPTVTGTYTITLGTNPSFTDTLNAGVETCYNISLSNGTYVVTLLNNAAVSVSKNVSVTSCSNYTASYDCTTGLTILENGSPWTGKIRVDGSPISYWTYTGPNTVFLADTTPNHVVTIYSPSLVELSSITLTGIDCCNLRIIHEAGICDPITSEGFIIFTIDDIAHPVATHSVVIKNASNTIVESTPNFVGTVYTSVTLPNGTYSIFVTDDSYMIPNVGIGRDYECVANKTVNLNCAGCTIGTGLGAFLTTLPNTLLLNVQNNNGYAVNFEVWRKDVGPPYACNQVSDPPPGVLLTSSSLLTGGSVSLNYALNSTGTHPCFYVKFIKQNDANCRFVKLAVTAN